MSATEEDADHKKMTTEFNRLFGCSLKMRKKLNEGILYPAHPVHCFRWPFTGCIMAAQLLALPCTGETRVHWLRRVRPKRLQIVDPSTIASTSLSKTLEAKVSRKSLAAVLGFVVASVLICAHIFAV
jgi:hypothetical protein